MELPAERQADPMLLEICGLVTRLKSRLQA
jgi:hypothetical protein